MRVPPCLGRAAPVVFLLVPVCRSPVVSLTGVHRCPVADQALGKTVGAIGMVLGATSGTPGWSFEVGCRETPLPWFHLLPSSPVRVRKGLGMAVWVALRRGPGGHPAGGSYLVDSASSHMLVSKIKPCMSKYKHFVL